MPYVPVGIKETKNKKEMYVYNVLISDDTEKVIEELKLELTKLFEMCVCIKMYLNQNTSIERTNGMEDSKSALRPINKRLQLQVSTKDITNQPCRELLSRLI